MGGNSSSKITQENNQLFINKSTVNTFTEDVINTAINNTMSLGSGCTNSIFNDQNFNLSNLKIKGNLNLDVNQIMQDYTTFGCVNDTNARNSIGVGMIQTFLDNIKNASDNNILNILNARAEATSNVEFNPFTQSKSNTNVNQINDTTIYSENVQNIVNTIKDSLAVNMETKIMSECINKNFNEQNFNISYDEVGGNVDILLEQAQANQIVSNCINKTVAANNVIAEVLNYLGVETINDTENQVTTIDEAVASAVTFIKGIFESLGSFIGNILSSIGLAVLAPFAIPISSFSSVCFCCCCCLFILVAFGLLTSLSN